MYYYVVDFLYIPGLAREERMHICAIEMWYHITVTTHKRVCLSNHLQLDCFLNSLLGSTTKKPSGLYINGPFLFEIQR